MGKGPLIFVFIANALLRSSYNAKKIGAMDWLARLRIAANNDLLLRCPEHLGANHSFATVPDFTDNGPWAELVGIISFAGAQSSA